MPNGPAPGGRRDAFGNLADAIELADLALRELGEPQVAVAAQRDAGRTARFRRNRVLRREGGRRRGGRRRRAAGDGRSAAAGGEHAEAQHDKKRAGHRHSPCILAARTAIPPTAGPELRPSSGVLIGTGRSFAAVVLRRRRKRKLTDRRGGEANRRNDASRAVHDGRRGGDCNARPTPPPEIYRVVSRPLCTQLRERIKPAIGMLLQNDTSIKAESQRFRTLQPCGAYRVTMPVPDRTASKKWRCSGWKISFGPIANNVIAIQTMLSNPQLTTPSGREDDDKR